MINGGQKRIVIIKDIHSNNIEEAILILKNNPGSNYTGSGREVSYTNKKKDNNYLLREAEMIINNYIKESYKQDSYKGQPVKKVRGFEKKNSLNIIINLVLIGSIALLVLIVTKMM